MITSQRSESAGTPDSRNATFARRSLPLLGLLLLGSCATSTYESGTFLPRREVHELRVQEDERSRVAAEVDASIVGVMRAQDGVGPRIHARLVVDNPGDRPLRLIGGESRLTPGSVLALAPSTGLSEIDVEPGTERTVDLFFPLPGEDELPRQALSELELSWVLDVDGQAHESRATFQRASRTRVRSAGWYGPGWYGPGWYDPLWYPYPYYGPGIGFSYGYCR